MKIVFLVIVFLHGVIHLFGFLKGFKLSEIERLSGDISGQQGFFWLIAFLLFLTSAVLVLANKDWWWMFGILAVIISQILIIMQWQDAKFGSVANFIVFVVILFAVADWNFNNMVKNEVNEFLRNSKSNEKIVKQEDLTKLPSVIQKWLYRSNTLGKQMFNEVNLTQSGEMRTAPDGKWMNFKAEQWFSTSKPGFIWYADVSMFPGIYMTGRDKFINGEGNMLIKLLSLITVVDSKGDEINQGTLLRYIGESVWFPYAALNDYYIWEEIDPLTAKVTMKDGATQVSGIFRFTEDGDFSSFEAERYYERKEGASLENWLVTVNENGYKDFDGIRIPAKLSVIWKLKEGDFNWLNLEITDINFR